MQLLLLPSPDTLTSVQRVQASKPNTNHPCQRVCLGCCTLLDFLLGKHRAQAYEKKTEGTRSIENRGIAILPRTEKATSPNNGISESLTWAHDRTSGGGSDELLQLPG